MNYNYDYFKDNCYHPESSCFRPSWEKCPLERKCQERLEHHCCHHNSKIENRFSGCVAEPQYNIGDCCKCHWNNN